MKATVSALRSVTNLGTPTAEPDLRGFLRKLCENRPSGFVAPRVKRGRE